MNSVHEQCQRTVAQTVHNTVQYATRQPYRACCARCASGRALSLAQGHSVVCAGPPIVRVMRPLLNVQGALSSCTLAMHCRDISSMLQHGKSHVQGFSIVIENSLL